MTIKKSNNQKASDRAKSKGHHVVKATFYEPWSQKILISDYRSIECIIKGIVKSTGNFELLLWAFCLFFCLALEPVPLSADNWK